MNSYNLSICVSPSIMWPPVNSKLAATEQTSGTSDVVCFLIDNYLEIFSVDCQYVLGEESDIQLNDGPGEDSDSGNDQVIYRCRQPSLEDTEDEPREDSDLLRNPQENSIESPLAHSDSSIGTDDSDDNKLNCRKLSIPSVSLPPQKIWSSKSTPSSPSLRLEIVDKNSVQINSDTSDIENVDQNEQFQRKLLRQPKQRRILSSTTTSAELIEHKRLIAEQPVLTSRQLEKERTSFESQNKRRGGNYKIKPNNNDELETSDSGSATRKHVGGSPGNSPLIPRKQIISQPVIQHFATEYFATPNVVFHSVDRRRQPAAPSYEEHIQRTQAKHRIIGTNIRKPSLMTRSKLIQQVSVDDYQPPKPPITEVVEDRTKKSITEVVEDHATKSITRTLNRTNNTLIPSPTENDTKHILKNRESILKTSLATEIENAICQSKTFELLSDIPISSSSICFEGCEIVELKSEIVESSAMKEIIVLPTKSKVQKLNLLNVNETEATPFITHSGSNSDQDLTIIVSPQSNSPFALKLTSPTKIIPTAISDNRGQSLQLKKTLLTKAPMKLDQLTNRNSDLRDEKVLTAREMRRTNRKLKSEIRNAFNQGEFLYKSPYRERQVNLENSGINGHYGTDKMFWHEKISGRLHGEISKQMNKENIQTNSTSEVLKSCKKRYNENTNVSHSHKKTITSHQVVNNASTSPNMYEKDVYERILSQEESYV